MSDCTIKKRLDNRSAPIEVLEHSGLSAEAKVILTWTLMHQNGWVVKIGYMLDRCNVSERVWKRARKELIEAGFFVQRRISEKNEDGQQRLIWKQEMTEEPLYNNGKIEKTAA